MTAPAVPFNNLYFIQAKNVPAIEVHEATADHCCTTAPVNTVTPIPTSDNELGNFVIDNGDMKVRNTASKTIEVHRLSTQSTHKKFDIQTKTCFSGDEWTNGTFKIDNGNLYFIKFSDTGLHVDLFMASRQDNYTQVSLQSGTPIPVEASATGWFTVRGGDLYMIKTSGTASGKVEVHCAPGALGYQEVDVYVSWMIA